MNSFLKFLGKNKLYAAIEAFGLIVSLAFVILIGSYVWQQYEVTRENPDGDRIYGFGKDDLLAMGWWDKEALDSIPGVESITRLSSSGQEVLKFSDKIYLASCGEIDTNFFSIFHYRILEGSLQDFQSGGSVLVSKSFASKIDDGNGVLGRTISRTTGEYGGESTYKDYVIGGIVEDFGNSLVIGHDIFMSAGVSPYKDAKNRFMSFGTHTTIIKRQKEADEETFKQNILDKCYENYRFFNKEDDVLHLYNYKEMYFHRGAYFLHHSDKTILRLLLIVVLLLVASAIINYINLNVALVRKRSREMATRRLHGATKAGVIWKYISESLLFTAVCFAAALILAYLLTPVVSSLLSGEFKEQDISLRFVINFKYVAAYILAILVFGTLAGLLPALEASKAQPIDVIRGTYARRSRMVLGKFFIVFQNALSVILIALAITMELQMKHLLDRPMNFTSENLFTFAGPSTIDQIKPLEERLRKLPFVEEIGYGRGFPGNINMRMTRKMDVGGEERNMEFAVIGCDSTYFRLLGLEKVEDFGHPMNNSMWLSETAFRMAGVSDTSTYFARSLTMNNITADYIGGVIKDTPSDRLEASEENQSICVLVAEAEKSPYSCNPLIKITPSVDKAYVEKTIMDTYKEYMEETHGFSNDPYFRGFLEDILADEVAPAVRTMRLLEMFMALAVMISLLGLIAMSTYFSGENTKQIAVRKVFGSNVAKETARSVKAYLVLVFIAIIIGVPIAWYACSRYLEQYAYRIGGVILPIVLAVMLTLVFAACSVLWQVLRSARTNPAVALKKE